MDNNSQKAMTTAGMLTCTAILAGTLVVFSFMPDSVGPGPAPTPPVVDTDTQVAIRYLSEYADRCATAYAESSKVINATPSASTVWNPVTNTFEATGDAAADASIVTFHTTLSAATKAAREQAAQATIDPALEAANQTGPAALKTRAQGIGAGFKRAADDLKTLLKK